MQPSLVVVTRLSRVESRARTRAALLDAAGRVFVARGFAGASVEAIAHEAGYTRGAFYSNFASKEQLFAELLQERVYARYRRMAERILRGEERPSWRRSGEALAAMQADPEGRWLLALWFELLAQSMRDPAMRALAAGFWSGNRALVAEIVRREYAARNSTPPIAPERIATAIIAMDIGVALQHHVDPEAVPLDVYPEIWEIILGRAIA